MSDSLYGSDRPQRIRRANTRGSALPSGPESAVTLGSLPSQHARGASPASRGAASQERLPSTIRRGRSSRRRSFSGTSTLGHSPPSIGAAYARPHPLGSMGGGHPALHGSANTSSSSGVPAARTAAAGGRHSPTTSYRTSAFASTASVRSVSPSGMSVTSIGSRDGDSWAGGDSSTHSGWSDAHKRSTSPAHSDASSTADSASGGGSARHHPSRWQALHGSRQAPHHQQDIHPPSRHRRPARSLGSSNDFLSQLKPPRGATSSAANVAGPSVLIRGGAVGGADRGSHSSSKHEAARTTTPDPEYRRGVHQRRQSHSVSMTALQSEYQSQFQAQQAKALQVQAQQQQQQESNRRGTQPNTVDPALIHRLYEGQKRLWRFHIRKLRREEVPEVREKIVARELRMAIVKGDLSKPLAELIARENHVDSSFVDPNYAGADAEDDVLFAPSIDTSLTYDSDDSQHSQHRPAAHRRSSTAPTNGNRGGSPSHRYRANPPANNPLQSAIQRRLLAVQDQLTAKAEQDRSRQHPQQFSSPSTSTAKKPARLNVGPPSPASGFANSLTIRAPSPVDSIDGSLGGSSAMPGSSLQQRRTPRTVRRRVLSPSVLGGDRGGGDGHSRSPDRSATTPRHHRQAPPPHRPNVVPAPHSTSMSPVLDQIRRAERRGRMHTHHRKGLSASAAALVAAGRARASSAASFDMTSPTRGPSSSMLAGGPGAHGSPSGPSGSFLGSSLGSGSHHTPRIRRSANRIAQKKDAASSQLLLHAQRSVSGSPFEDPSLRKPDAQLTHMLQRRLEHPKRRPHSSPPELAAREQADKAVEAKIETLCAELEQTKDEDLERMESTEFRRWLRERALRKV